MAGKLGGLGKGLDAIFIENDTNDSNNNVFLKISDIEPNQEPTLPHLRRTPCRIPTAPNDRRTRAAKHR